MCCIKMKVCLQSLKSLELMQSEWMSSGSCVYLIHVCNSPVLATDVAAADAAMSACRHRYAAFFGSADGQWIGRGLTRILFLQFNWQEFYFLILAKFVDVERLWTQGCILLQTRIFWQIHGLTRTQSFRIRTSLVCKFLDDTDVQTHNHPTLAH